jgi:hypothetical protein
MKRFSVFIKSLYEETRYTTVTSNDEFVHPVARRGIEKAKAKGSLDVYIPDPDDLTKEKLIGTMRPGESDYDFSQRMATEPGRRELSSLRGYRGRDYSQQEFNDLDRFDKQGDPRVYDQTTGSTRGKMEAGRQEQERDETNIGAWWDQGGGSNNPSVQGWRTTGFERAAASRAKNREQDQHFDNVERSMAGEVGPTQRFKDNFAWSSMSNMAKATGVKGPDLERITSGERRKKSIEIMRSARQQEQQRRNERIEQERKAREQAQKEQAARHEEMRKRAQERSKPVARPAGGREEPPPSGQTALRV